MRIGIKSLVLILILFSVSCVAQKTSAENITKIANLKEARAAHTATRLLDGSVLVVGGMHKNGLFYDTAEVFSPSANSFSTLKHKMVKKRVSHSATLLKDGRVLILGGWSNRNAPESTAEIFDPKTQQFSALPDLEFRRSGHSSTLLDSGKVLIAGGNEGERILSEVEIFDPETNSFQRIASMKFRHAIHSATKLNDGRVLILGGENARNNVTADAEIFDPETNTFTELPAKMNASRYKHDAVLLADGNVLVFGGADERDRGGKLKTAEIFDPRAETFTKTNDMNFARFKIAETSVVLPSGKVLIAGGSEEAEIFDPKMKIFSRVSGSFGKSFHFASVTLLSDGRALILGGYEYVPGSEPASTDQAWIYREMESESAAIIRSRF